MCQFLNSYLMENNSVVEKPIDMTQLAKRLAKKSTEFIRKSSDRPFLLVHSFAHVHTPLHTSPEFAGQSQHGVYGDVLMETDHCLGLILDEISRQGIEEETLVYFTSDHGGDWPQLGNLGKKISARI